MEYRTVTIKTLVLCLLLGVCSTEKLSLQQKAPPFARGSGGLSLPVPLASAPEGGSNSLNTRNDNEVQQEETASLKLVGDQLVRTVEGRYSYKSPEGLPVAVKYTSDENGTRASFTLGTGSGSKSGSMDRNSKSSSSSNGKTRPNNQNGDSAYLPPQPQQDVNNGYLPPQ